jgi:glycosyltransferase involved in cell wall biosynthesis
MLRWQGRVTNVFKENGGQASAFNAGWRHCRGDAVVFLDADDVLLPGAVRAIAAAFTATPDAAKVQYRLCVIDGHGAPTGAVKPPVHIPLPNGDLRRSELTFPFDLTWMATSGNAFAAAALRRVMPVPEAEFAHCGDWYLNHLTALLGEIVSLQEVLGGMRIHGSNSYEMGNTTLDLDQLRRTISYSLATRRHLRRLATELELPLRSGPILSVADLANRMISLKLEPDAHPLAHDRVSRLVIGGTAAALRRFDIRWEMKLLFMGWFAAMAVAPRRPARFLARLFVFPELRRRVNPVLGRLKRQAGR